MADGSIDTTALVAVPDEGDSAERPKLTGAEAGRLGAEHGHKGGVRLAAWQSENLVEILVFYKLKTTKIPMNLTTKNNKIKIFWANYGNVSMMLYHVIWECQESTDPSTRLPTRGAVGGENMGGEGGENLGAWVGENFGGKNRCPTK